MRAEVEVEAEAPSCSTEILCMSKRRARCARTAVVGAKADRPWLPERVSPVQTVPARQRSPHAVERCKAMAAMAVGSARPKAKTALTVRLALVVVAQGAASAAFVFSDARPARSKTP